MFYIKKQITKNNTSKKVLLDENNDIISESEEVITKTVIEVQYYGKISVNESSFIDVFVENFDGKFLFDTEEEANNTILQNPICVDAENVSYFVESV